MVDEWEVTDVVAGELASGPMRVARWAILDGTSEPALAEGDTRRLTLEPLDRNPQLEGVFVSDDLGPGAGSVYYVID